MKHCSKLLLVNISPFRPVALQVSPKPLWSIVWPNVYDPLRDHAVPVTFCSISLPQFRIYLKLMVFGRHVQKDFLQTSCLSLTLNLLVRLASTSAKNFSWVSTFLLLYPDQCQGSAEIRTLSLTQRQGTPLRDFLLAPACPIKTVTLWKGHLYLTFCFNLSQREAKFMFASFLWGFLALLCLVLSHHWWALTRSPPFYRADSRVANQWEGL